MFTERNSIYNFCMEENMPIFEAGGASTLDAYNLVKALCAFWLAI